MRNSRRKASLFLLSVCIVAALLVLTDLALYPCTFIRNDVHAVLAEKKDLVILGSSNGKMDLDPDVILRGTGKSGQNLCVGGEYPVDAYYLTKLMVEKNPPERILFELDPGYFMSDKEPGNNYLLFFHEFPLSSAKLLYFADTLLNCDLRAVFFPAYEYSLSYELPRIPDTLYRKLSGDYSVEPFKGKVQEYHENGWIEKYPVEEADFPDYQEFTFRINESVIRNTEYLQKLSELCKKQKIEFSIAVMPLQEVALKQDSDAYLDAWKYFEKWAQDFQVKLFNFNTEYYNAYSHDSSCFVDYDGHMNGKNAERFSEVLGTVLKKGEKNSG